GVPRGGAADPPRPPDRQLARYNFALGGRDHRPEELRRHRAQTPAGSRPVPRAHLDRVSRPSPVRPHRATVRRRGRPDAAGLWRAGRFDGADLMPNYDIDGLKRALAGIKIEDNPAIVKQKSRDFFWYSPVLKRQLDHVTADLALTPQDEAGAVPILAAGCRR